MLSVVISFRTSTKGVVVPTSWTKTPKGRGVLSNQRRTFCAVKELPWCAPKDSPNRRTNNKPTTTKQGDKYNNDTNTIDNNNTKMYDDDRQGNTGLPIITRFGIIAAMCSKTRMIGRDNKLPWNIPEDRSYFKNITRDRVLIIGKNTLYECGRSLHHIGHVKHCIVVSTSLTQEQMQRDFDAVSLLLPNTNKNNSDDKSFLYLARSFTESLQIANTLLPLQDVTTEGNQSNGTDTSTSTYSNYDCWIGGGERLYKDAIVHPSAKVLHLTIVDDDNDVDDYNNNHSSSTPPTTTLPPPPPKFPAKYRWDHLFKLVHQTPKQQSSITSSNISFTHTIYQRKESIEKYEK